MKLTEQNYWESLNSGHTAVGEASDETEPRSRLERSWPGSAKYTREVYAEYHFWHELLPRFLTRDPAKTVIEIGSAPGTQSVKFHRHFGYRPYGLEYTASGAEVNRETFRRQGLDPAHVLEDDFFSAGFLDTWRGRFDAAFSRGFIEHFDDVPPVVARHADLLKPGGHLIISIPHLQGLNRFMTRRFVPDLLPLHNLHIMNRTVFRDLFDPNQLETLYCGFQGGLHLLMGDIRPGAVPAGILSGLRKTQLGFNILQGLTGPFDSPWTSPNLVYVGRRKVH